MRSVTYVAQTFMADSILVSTKVRSLDSTEDLCSFTGVGSSMGRAGKSYQYQFLCGLLRRVSFPYISRVSLFIAILSVCGAIATYVEMTMEDPSIMARSQVAPFIISLTSLTLATNIIVTCLFFSLYRHPLDLKQPPQCSPNGLPSMVYTNRNQAFNDEQRVHKSKEYECYARSSRGWRHIYGGCPYTPMYLCHVKQCSIRCLRLRESKHDPSLGDGTDTSSRLSRL